jgi:hypothetical protein
VPLRIDTRCHIEKDAALSFLFQTGMGVLKSELRFANTGGADKHGHRARQQSAAEFCVQTGYAC